MKKILIIAGLCLTSSMAFAAGTAVCDGAGGGTAIAGTTTSFIRTGFTPKCSANTHVAYEQNAIAVAAAGGSKKGKSVFGGTSGGGGVNVVTACAQTGCVAGDATGATAALLAQATN